MTTIFKLFITHIFFNLTVSKEPSKRLYSIAQSTGLKIETYQFLPSTFFSWCSCIYYKVVKLETSLSEITDLYEHFLCEYRLFILPIGNSNYVVFRTKTVLKWDASIFPHQKINIAFDIILLIMHICVNSFYDIKYNIWCRFYDIK